MKTRITLYKKLKPEVKKKLLVDLKNNLKNQKKGPKK